MKFKSAILFPLIILMSGCASWFVPVEAGMTAGENAKLSDAFLLFMDGGQTSREVEQNYIRACRRAWHAQNYALNDVPLPKDVEIWESRRKLGMANDPAASTPPPPAPPARRSVLPR